MSDMLALADIATERRRQIEVEGWTPEHDDEHVLGEMAKAAAVYAVREINLSCVNYFRGQPMAAYRIWPWEMSWWKPRSRRENLVRAGALIVAEIDRLDRAALRARAAADDGRG